MKRLKDLREDHDLKQAEVAAHLGISQQYYQCYESGKNELPLRHGIKLAKFYNVSLDYLVGLTDTPSSLDGRENLELARLKQLITRYGSASEKIKKAIDILLEE
ncbi:MAG: helix-turn-helix transcriptional regulator [Clostridia bacterium]|nr:helix-turn-helix transcriptional regulator [Clostridia bacterium]